MGYQVTFTPTEEAMAKYKPWKEERPNDSHTDTFKFELVSYCMKKHEEGSSQILQHIKFLLRCLDNAVRDEENTNAYFRWKDDEKHELWYCGWEFSHESYVDKDTTMNNTAESLFILTDIVETPSYFDNHEQFFTKYNDIVEDIDGFIDAMRECAIHDIINDLDEYKVKNEEE